MADAKYTVRTKHTKTTTEITVERDSFVAVRGVRGWCHQCAVATSLITLDEAAVAFGASMGTIYQWLESGKLHFSNASAASLQICLGSLLSPD